MSKRRSQRFDDGFDHHEMIPNSTEDSASSDQVEDAPSQPAPEPEQIPVTERLLTVEMFARDHGPIGAVFANWTRLQANGRTQKKLKMQWQEEYDGWLAAPRV